MSRHALPPRHHLPFRAAVRECPATGAGGTGQPIPESRVAGRFAVAEAHSRAPGVNHKESGRALYLIVKRRDRFTADDETDWRRMVGIDSRFEMLKKSVDDVHGLFEKGITKSTARGRRNRGGEECSLRRDAGTQACDPRGRTAEVREDDRGSRVREPRPDEQPRGAREQVVPDAAEDPIPQEEDADAHAGA
jgi:hypothetical protein